MTIEKDAIKNLFLELVKIDSPSGHEKQVREFIAKQLKKLQIEHIIDEHGNIIAFVSGLGESLLISAHMDTVDPGRNIAAIVDGDVIKTNGETILGADDKAGITEILCALAELKQKEIPHRPLEIVFTCEEEIGLLGAQKLDQRFITAKEGIVVDRSGHPQAVVIASPFTMKIDIEIIGKAAHAGNAERGINAIKIASDAIAKLKIGRIDEETTNNIGVIAGGSVRNAVAEKITIQMEVRSHGKAKMTKQAEKIEKQFEKTVAAYGAKLKFSSEFGCTGYKYSEKDPFVQKIAAVWNKMGFDPFFEKAGGASDANEFAKWGINVVDIGYGGMNPHTTNEHVKISDMQIISEFIVNFVKA